VSKKLIGERKETTEVKKATFTSTPWRGGWSPVMIEQNIPITIDIEEFQYAYKCKHCGHVWSEEHVAESKA